MRTAAWIKSLVAGGVIIAGGPMLIKWVSPTEEELFKRYNPDLQKRSLEGREDRLREANEFIDKIKEYSKDSRPIWTVWKEDAMNQKKAAKEAEKAAKSEKKNIAAELRRQRLEGRE